MNIGTVPRGRGRGLKSGGSRSSTGEFGARRGFRSDTAVNIHAVGFQEVQRQNIVENKQGTGGTPINLMSNYFLMERPPNWELYQYHVSFNPTIDHKKVKRGVLWQKKETFGKASVFDGSTLTTFNQIPLDELDLTVPDKMNPEKSFQITLTHVSTLKSGDYSFIQLYNNIVRKCLLQMNMVEVGRNFFDPNNAIEIKAHNLLLWPGFKTSIRQHDGGLMLCVEATTKVLRTETVLDTLKNLAKKSKDRVEYQNAAKREICGSIVLSTYNNKTHTIADIDFAQNPLSTFEKKKGEQVTYGDYFKTRHEQDITDLTQPLLLVEPKKEDFHRRESSGPCYLIPELCKLTGLTDVMRANVQFMKSLSKYLFQDPEDRVTKTEQFMKDLQETPVNAEELGKWGIKFNPNFIECPGRILTSETIVSDSNNVHRVSEKADWTPHVRSKPMLSTIKLDRWAIIVPQRDSTGVDNFVEMLKKVGTQMNFRMELPIVIEKLSNSNTPTYLLAIKKVVAENSPLQMVLVILTNNASANYSAIKKTLSVTHGIPSQCVLAKNVNNNPKGIMTIATKMAIQMNAKLGGEPWTVKIPVKNTMVVGFDSYHGSSTTAGKSVGALVASTGATMASFFSSVSFHSDGAELTQNLSTSFRKCLDAYKDINGHYPEKIILYRDGVADGQLEFVQETELKQFLEILEELPRDPGQEKPKLTYIIVGTKINTRLYTEMKANPSPGTVCDDVVTLPERYDFFLIPQTARQGAVSPSSYNVIYDSQGWKPERIQAFTYKMCHLYFNWSGTVAVPAPCKYAHKLASQTGTSTGAAGHDKLAFNLHYL